MRVEYISPFIEAVKTLFTKMLESKATQGNLNVADQGGGPYDITSMIGLGGPARGSVTMSFPNQTALGMASRLLSTELEEVDSTVTDAISEFVNIVAGAAKTKISHEDAPIELSLPSVVKGDNFKVIFPSKAIWIEVPFESEFGPFSIRVIFEFTNKEKGSKRHRE